MTIRKYGPSGSEIKLWSGSINESGIFQSHGDLDAGAGDFRGGGFSGRQPAHQFFQPVFRYFFAHTVLSPPAAPRFVRADNRRVARRGGRGTAGTLPESSCRSIHARNLG